MPAAAPVDLPTVRDVSKRAPALGSPIAVRHLVQRGHLPCVRLGGRTFVRGEDLDRLLQSGTCWREASLSVGHRGMRRLMNASLKPKAQPCGVPVIRCVPCQKTVASSSRIRCGLSCPDHPGGPLANSTCRLLCAATLHCRFRGAGSHRARGRGPVPD